MEQHRTRPLQPWPQPRPPSRPRSGPPVPPQAARGGARTPQQVRPGVSRDPLPVFPLVRAVHRMPNPRLTGLGSGLFCLASMFALALLDRLLFGSSLLVYGVLFLPVCALTAIWVRRADLVTAPIAVPIAFAFGLLPIADSDGGFWDGLMGLFTALAMHAGWLYGGTLIAGLIVTVRKVRMMSRRPAQRRPAPQSPRPPAQKRRPAQTQPRRRTT